MNCKKPFVSSAGVAHGCGQCMPCRFNKRRVWMHRIMLEACQYEDNAFITLTYDDEHLPKDGSLRPKDVQDWLKRLRARLAPLTIRFFLVGEYGDETQRPHYHVALFGFKSCQWGNSRYSATKSRCCVSCDLVRETWQHGNVFLGSLEDDSAGYMAGYVTKKMTSKDDPRLNGRHPEFGRMSLRPGIGYSAMWEVADAMLRYELDDKLPDVPVALRHGAKELPLGRYLRRKLRSMVGKDEKISQEAWYELQKEMLALRQAALADKAISFREYLIEKNAGRVAGMEARAKLYKGRRSL